MRFGMIWATLGLSAALASMGCATMKKVEKEAVADLKQAGDIKKEVEAIKKGDVNAVGDASLEVAVKGALTKNDKTKSAGIQVDAKDGVVYLKGNMSADVKTEAEKVAKGVPGVTKVSFGSAPADKKDDAKHDDKKDDKKDDGKKVDRSAPHDKKDDDKKDDGKKVDRSAPKK